jgi:Protein of unknown function (DUF1569)
MKTLGRERDKMEILRRLGKLRPDSERQWGRLSAHQMVCHLNDSFRLVTGERHAKPTSGVTVVLQRTIVKWTALWVPLRWLRGIPTVPEIDQEIGGTRPLEFAADLADLEGLIEVVSTRRFERTVHPFFGRMSAAAWLRWGYLHVDHHLRQFRL